MKVEVLAATMNQKDFSIIDEMNIKTNAIVINQCDHNDFETVKRKNYVIKFISFNERGVGLSRNNALMRATEDIVIFADQDIKYVDDYEKIIVDEFNKRKNADFILFNVPSLNPKRPTINIMKSKRIHFYNCLKYGAVNFAVKLDRLKRNNIYFSLLFGGGAKYSAGEDSIFIYECVRSGMKVYSCPKIIGYVKQEESTWFNGYNAKFFNDIGVLYSILFKHNAYLMCFQYLIRHKKVWKNFGFKNALHYMITGVKAK